MSTVQDSPLTDANGRPLRRRSGSETRQRTVIVQIRFTPEERTLLDEAASRAGLTISSYARARLIGRSLPRSVARPSIDRELMARLIGQLGKIGSNLNQIARAANMNIASMRDLDAALREAAEFRAAIRPFLGEKD
ncbi:MAG: plasmid mobilization protein [Rhodomicrobium sp.]